MLVLPLPSDTLGILSFKVILGGGWNKRFSKEPDTGSPVCENRRNYSGVPHSFSIISFKNNIRSSPDIIESVTCRQLLVDELDVKIEDLLLSFTLRQL